MILNDRIAAFVRLGAELREKGTALSGMEKIMTRAGELNPWFTEENIRFALDEISRTLQPERLERWLAAYRGSVFDHSEPKKIGVILAGNIPLVGFHDFLSVLLSGNIFCGKLSGKDDLLLPWLAERIVNLMPGIVDRMKFIEGGLGQVDAIIATGSDNTSRYFEYYFGKYPHIFRNNRNGIAILDGSENASDLSLLADDIFRYFGLGCRSVSKIYLPADYDFGGFFQAMEKYKYLADHHKYANNYLYQRSVYLMNLVEHLDNGFLLLKEDSGLSSPVGTLYYEYYTETEILSKSLADKKEKIQCIAGRAIPGLEAIPFGRTQHPEPWDYADNMDTLFFLHNLYKN